MRRRMEDVVLADGVVKNVSVAKNGQKASVKIDAGDGILDVSFNNGKENRADAVKKLRLKEGDRVITIGRRDRASFASVWGYEIRKSGLISKGGTAFIRGTIAEASPYAIILKTGNGKTFHVKTAFPNDLCEGETATAACHIERTKTCDNLCESWSVSKCAGCRKFKNHRSYVAMDIAR